MMNIITITCAVLGVLALVGFGVLCMILWIAIGDVTNESRKGAQK